MIAQPGGLNDSLYDAPLTDGMRQRLGLCGVCEFFGTLVCVDCDRGLARPDGCDLSCWDCETRDDCPCRKESPSEEGL